MKLIHSKDNSFYKELLKLSGSARLRGKLSQTILDGVHLLGAYLDAGMQPKHVLLNPSALDDDEITGLLDRIKGVPVTQLDEKLFSGLSDLKTPTGLMALIDIPLPDRPISHCRFSLLLENIQDPGNLGSMLRSAAAAGCDGVFLSSGCTDAWSPKVLRAAMGGHFALQIQELQDLQDIAKAFTGVLLATTLKGKLSLYECDLNGNLAFLIGNEGAGLSCELLNLASQEITIPMYGKVESLNAAAATAICLFEAVRQRRMK